MHLFGFGQGTFPACHIDHTDIAVGGSLAAEAAFRYPSKLGSAVIITGPLLSLPTGKASDTPVLLCSRKQGQQVKKAWFDKGFTSVQELQWNGNGGMRECLSSSCLRVLNSFGNHSSESGRMVACDEVLVEAFKAVTALGVQQL